MFWLLYDFFGIVVKSVYLDFYIFFSSLITQFKLMFQFELSDTKKNWSKQKKRKSYIVHY